MFREEDYKKIYIQEGEELLQQMNKGLLVLEKNPEDIDSLNAIFRSAHTLKSMSASMGYTPIAELSHKMEDVLGEMRDGKGKVTSESIEVLFRSFDVLESLTNQVAENKPVQADIVTLLKSLDGLLHRSDISVQEDVSGGGLVLNEFEKRTLERVTKDGFTPYLVRIFLEDSCVLKSVRAFMIFRNLHSIGEVIKSYPESRKLEEEKFGKSFECVFISREKETVIQEKVMEILEVERVEIETIVVDESWAEPSMIASGEVIETSGVPLEVGEQVRKIRSVRVDVTSLDKLMNLVEELAISKLRMQAIDAKRNDPELRGVTEHFSRLVDELQSEVMKARLVPAAQIFDRFPRMVRDLARKQNKRIRFEINGGDIELDRSVLDEIGDPLIHLLKNSIDHGIESSEDRRKSGKSEEACISLTAQREKNHVLIEVKDDGRGIDVNEIGPSAIRKGIVTAEALAQMTPNEVLYLVTAPGFSTKTEVTDISGRGVGLDVVREKAETLSGEVLLDSQPGKGLTVTMRLPITAAVIPALLVKVATTTFAIPVASVIEIIVVAPEQIKRMEHGETILHRNRVLQIVHFKNLFPGFVDGDVERDKMRSMNVVVVETLSLQFGIVVERLIGQQDIVIKQLSRELKRTRGVAGGTILGDGRVALVLDVATLV